MASNENDSITETGDAVPLIKLQSKGHEEILNVIDELRSEGISKYVSLPQLIVCGDQSSGKSSVLEAISGLSFPRKDNVCTRFATELILRRAPDAGVTAFIHPDDDRSLAEKDRLRRYKSPTLALDRFEEIVHSAGSAIGISKDGLPFSKDVLRVEVSGPTQPHLTLVDLPGLYHASDESQSEEGVAFVESLVLSYMQNPRSVMLAVMSAKSDIALQKVTSFTRRVDSKGERTMGIITKPDTLAKGSEMEQSFFNLATNKRMPFRLGWHVLKNRTYEERNLSIKERHDSETDFLSRGIWASLPRSRVCVGTLRPRLSTVLQNHILTQMSSFIVETQAAYVDAEESLQKLGQARQTLIEQRRHLLHASERFTTLISAAVNGIYADPFFGNSMNDQDYEKRLRAVTQNRLSDFSDSMFEQGEHRKIVSDHEFNSENDRCIARSQYVKEVRRRMRRGRGCELPGTFNPLIVGELFFLHSQPWQGIVNEYVDILLQDVRKATLPILKEVLDDRSVEGLLRHVVSPHLTKLEEGLRAKAAELLEPQRMGHPITYNHYFTENIQQTRQKHLRESITEKLESFLGDNYPGDPDQPTRISLKVTGLIEALSRQDNTDMEHFACSEATDYMLAYYKVARKKFVDDFSVLAVEKHLLEPLLTVYCPGTVNALDDAVLNDIAKEDESMTIERKRLTEKMSTLRKSLDRLHRLDLHSLAANRVSDTALREPDDIDAESSVVSDIASLDGLPDESVPAPDEPVFDEPVAEESVSETAFQKIVDVGWPTIGKKTKRNRHPSADLWESRLQVNGS